MKYKTGDVVWLRKAGKAAVVIEVDKGFYRVRSYDGKECDATENALGKK